MARRASRFVATGIAMALTASFAYAAPVTLILKSGDRVRGDLVDFKTAGFVVNVRGAEQQVAREEVAAIAFTNAEFPAAETTKIQAGRAYVVLNSGDGFYGTLADIGGTTPLRLSFRTPDGDREINSGEVARIYFSKWQGMPQPAPQQPDLDQGGAGITVASNPCWTSTGRSVRQGQRVTFNGSGEIQLSADPKDIAAVGGSRIGRTSANAPIPGALAGALLGRVGNGRPFGIGDQTTPLSMPASGQLWLGVNDDQCGDNRGQFKVQIRTQR